MDEDQIRRVAEEGAKDAAQILRWVSLAQKLKSASSNRAGVNLSAQEVKDLMWMLQALRRGAEE